MTDDYFATCGKTGAAIRDCLVIDAHAHLGPVFGFPIVDSNPQSMIKVMDQIGIDRLFVSSIPAIFGQARYGNDCLLEWMRAYPQRISGYMALDVGYPQHTLGEMERCFALGFHAIKIYSFHNGPRPGPNYDHPNYDCIFSFANERALPVLAHTWGDELDELDAAFNTYDKIHWILAHTGSKDLHKYIHCANTYPRVYLETCFSACPRGLIEQLVNEVPEHKVIWGSDQPFMSVTHQIGRVLFSQITSEQKRAILGANVQRILESTEKG